MKKLLLIILIIESVQADNGVQSKCVGKFANPIAQAACAVDTVKATAGFPLDSMFWCSRCQGSMYPFTGHVSSHVGGVQASLLLVSRMLSEKFFQD